MTDQADQLRDIMNNESNTSPRIIAVTSGKGGVGKTNISTGLAIAYSKIGKKVILMDADLGLANINVILGIVPKYNLYHMLRKKRKLEDILIDTNYGFKIIAGASGFAKIANMKEDERQEFIDQLQALASVDIIIIDTGAGVSENVLSFIAAAHETIIVTTPEPTAITDAYGIIKIITTDIEDIGLGLKLIVNRVKSATEGTKIAKRVIDITGQFLNVKIEYVGYIYDDDIVHQAVVKQKPFAILDPKNKASICVQHILGRIERIEVGNKGGMSRFFNRMLRNK